MEKYHVRRQQLAINDLAEIHKIISKANYMTISMVLPDGSPYAVVLSHGFDPLKNCVYFHTGFCGRKLEALRHNPQVCGIVMEDHGYVEGKCHQKSRTAMIFGTMTEIADPDEKMAAIIHMYRCIDSNPDESIAGKKLTAKKMEGVNMLRLDIEHISGKSDLRD